MMFAPVKIFASMIELTVKLQQETRTAMIKTATTGVRELTRN
ncbi:hypothetical protein [Pseudonocardia yunnanensis]|uniref:Uncharacterized protein n=1 Tax=Pseudonocardia yunnanensis TaxID=58107 RepID=A0ABW4F2G2_9PSEU